MMWREQQLIAVILLGVYFSWRVGKRTHLYAGLVMAWTLISSSLVFMNLYSDLNVVVPLKWDKTTYANLRDRMDSLTAQAYIFSSMMAFAALTVKHRTINLFLGLGLPIFVVVNCTLIVFFKFGLFNNLAMDSTFIAMVYPLMMLRPEMREDRVTLPYNLLAVLAMFMPIVAFRESTAFFVLIGGFGAYFMARGLWKEVLLISMAVLSLAYFVTGDELFNSRGRLAHWDMFFQWWDVNANRLIGTGTGSFEWLGERIQNKSAPGIKEGVYLWMHNEYLQVLFEQGVVGLVLMLGLVYKCLQLSWKTPWLFAANAGVLVSFLTQFPLRWPLSMFYVCILIRLSLNEEDRRLCQFQFITNPQKGRLD